MAVWTVQNGTSTINQGSGQCTIRVPVQGTDYRDKCLYGRTLSGRLPSSPPAQRAYSWPKIVPIMAQRKSHSSGPAGNRTSPPEDSAMKMHLEMAMAGMPSKSSLKLGCLDYFNLYAMPVLGDGNCLFYSLSDQLYGSVDRHIEIRERLVQHMRDNADYFRDFTADVGGERRAPRRSAAQEKTVLRIPM
ncbi:predicted protein [Histoplasma mississippiense (nom. inval.)]|uniref:predicted protein n=1 Tax=Ajellomyces capsulatus (strain NAm1 / WU24) TaxID=2059318 RepID=UPI000157B468|nr:predicted protein [Histoplasma mississippiense (nom. inval.)]EDN03016.1 predicted protein [Histoplasma mississippiense (nom. inval.)]